MPAVLARLLPGLARRSQKRARRPGTGGRVAIKTPIQPIGEPPDAGSVVGGDVRHSPEHAALAPRRRMVSAAT
jgi:hypothetical protein